MATAVNGTNGYANGLSSDSFGANVRFSDIPRVIDIPVLNAVRSADDEEQQAVELDLEELLDDPTELCTLLENENAARTYWMAVSMAYAKQHKLDHAVEMLVKGLPIVAQSRNDQERLSMLSCLCWLYLWKSREAPRVAPEGTLVSEARTKEYYLQQANITLTDALRINPAFPPLFLARGVLGLLKASLRPPSKSMGPGVVDPERTDDLRYAIKCFEDALRVSGGRNMFALLGKSRAQFSLGKYAEALEGYQSVLTQMPGLTDPDPRIGIGCCFWQLGFKTDAKTAWERSLEINPNSKIANILLGLYHLDASAHVPTNSKEFIELYKKGMTEYTQKAFKADKDMPLTCATFAGYFLSRKSLQNADALAHKAIQYTDVNAIASDGWYILARKEHYSDDIERAADYYRRADEARGGLDRGYLPAKFGAAQLSVLKGDFGEAKLRLEKIIKQSKNVEAMVLLGTIYAEEVFASQYAAVKEDKTKEYITAVDLLEKVRAAWKDPKKSLSPDASVLLQLARLYEVDQPEKSLACLQQVEQIELSLLPAEGEPEDEEEKIVFRAKLRENLPPQLLNNIGCFQYQAEKYELARENFQTALTACIKAGEKQEGMDTDALVTTISYNLGRTYEAGGMLDEANTVYKGLLERHSGYIDARTRMAYISLRQNPTDEGPRTMGKLYQDAPTDLEVRALYGWYLNRVHSRKRNPNIADDPELRHYKHTLQNHEKHDRYALIGMGNLYLQTAREMRRESESDKVKRSQMYSRAVEFFEKALQIDPKNAYAAQGIAIALVEDKHDTKNALQIWMKVRETVKEANVFINLGHVFAELKQFSKAIESYELALSREGKERDPQVLTCLGKAWLAKARAEKSLPAYRSALDYSRKASEIVPEQVHFKFNIAFVQFQLAICVYNLPEAQRTLAEVESAAKGLEAAIESLDAIALHPQTPYPKAQVEARASMARNTIRVQLERALQAQKEFEERNAEKLKAAMESRQAELRKREEARLAAEEADRERKRVIAEERRKIAERDRVLAEARAEEDRAREEAEMTVDEETGERVRRKKGGKGAKRKKKDVEDISSGEESGAEPSSQKKRGGRRKQAKSGDEGDDSGEEKPKKKRKLASRKSTEGVKGSAKKESSKFKSSEIVVESDSEGDTGAAEARREMEHEDDDVFGGAGDDDAGPADANGADGDVGDAAPAAADDDDDEDEVAAAPVTRKSRARRIEESDDEDEDVPDAPEQAVDGEEKEVGEVGGDAVPSVSVVEQPATEDTAMVDAMDEDE